MGASEVEEAKKLITTASEYTIAMGIELTRRSLGADDQVAKSPEKLKRSLELAAYFTIPKLEVPHRQIALTSAMKQAFTNKNYNSALSFANRMLANGGAAKMLEQAKKIKANCERNPNDAVEIEFDLCAASYTPIYSGSAFEVCAFDGSKYQSKYKGTVCAVCGVCEVGKNGSGLKLVA